MKAPSMCQVRLCGAPLHEKTIYHMKCSAVSNHSAFLVELDGKTKWEFTSRGRTYLKGKVVEAPPVAGNKGKEDSSTPAPLCDDPPQGIKKKKAGKSMKATYTLFK
eukprot:Skav217310  [mRNA]  locus=C9162515:1720:2037:- [translate_table: standard]